MIQQRLKDLIEALELNTAQFAKKLGYSRPDRIYALINTENKPGFDTLVDILTTFPKVNARWLILGSGKMFLDDNTNVSVVPDDLVLLKEEMIKLRSEQISSKDKLIRSLDKIIDQLDDK
jgi:predicted transcriptional regulator